MISRQTASIDPLMKTLNTFGSASGIALARFLGFAGFSFHAVLDLSDFARPERAVFVGPSVVDELDRNRIEIKLADPTLLHRVDQIGSFEHARCLRIAILLVSNRRLTSST